MSVMYKGWWASGGLELPVDTYLNYRKLSLLMNLYFQGVFINTMKYTIINLKSPKSRFDPKSCQ